MFRWIAGVVVWAGAVGVASAQIKSEHFPADIAWVLRLDVKEINQSEMGQFLRDTLFQEENARHGLAALEGATGIKLTHDLHAIVAYGWETMRRGGVVFVYGRFDVARLTGLAAKAEDYQNKALGERSLLAWGNPGQRAYLCFVDATLAIFSQDEARVREAVARVDGQASDHGGGGAFAKTLTHEAGRFFAMQTSNLGMLSELNPQLKALKLANDALIEIRQMRATNGLEIMLAARASEAQVAEQLEQAAQGIQALTQLQAEKNPDAAAVAKGARVERVDDVVTVTLPIAEAALRERIQIRVEQRKAAMEARRPAGGPEQPDPPAPQPERPPF